ncbi:MAG TPA: M4 family metallopeptidase, partial [Chryseosolibacter sp.]|nr:M4 family metallopeptidase [Chryseosolibacter sp.]
MAQQNSRVNVSAVATPDPRDGKVYQGHGNEPPRAIEFEAGTVTASNFLANINKYFNIPADFTFIEAESNADGLGMRHRHLQQYYKGIPVEGMGYRVHEKDGFVRSANGKAVREIKLDENIRLSEEHAFQLAVKHLATRDTVFRSGKKLIVSKGFTWRPESFAIAFQFDVDVSLIERWRISIDALTGQVVNQVSLVNSCLTEMPQPAPSDTGTGFTNYYGRQAIRVEKYDDGSSRMVGQTENGGNIGTYNFNHASIWALLFGADVPVYDFYSANNTYDNLYQRPGVSVQWAAEQTFEYYFQRHNRNSFDNNGAFIKSYVHVDQDMDNAFWTGKLMAFGDGSNNNPLVELDVVGHEFTHGVTQYEAKLQYYQEPGALNESFSDIFGKAIEFDVFGDTATWQLAKHFRPGGLRDLSDPNLKNQPDTYAGEMWYTGYDDAGGVHTNSGVQNFWYYLLCEGGSGVNDQNTTYSVNAIGMEAADKIAYRNLTEYLTEMSDYLDSRIGSMMATADLYGKNSSIYQEVANAWDAVGVIDEPIIYSVEPYDVTATTVKVRGSLQPRGDTVSYYFEYGTTPDLGNSSATYKYTGTVEGIITGLQSETLYYIRLVATNENGSTFSPVTTFSTISLTPLVRIRLAVDVTETTATLHGEINPNSLSTSFYFEYGPTPDLGLVTPTYQLSDTTEFLSVSAHVTELQPRQSYYFRLIATNEFGSAESGSATFFTAIKPLIVSYMPSTAEIGAEVTIVGENFNPAAENNLVRFGATNAIVLSSSGTELKVRVPAGASLGPISVLDSESGLVGVSVQEFVPTFTGGFKKNDLSLTAGIADIVVYQVLVEDMDSDGRPDIVARSYPSFSVFQNVNQGGDVTNESFIRNTFSVEIHTELYLADFDGNGLKDIVAGYQDRMRIFPNYSVPGYIFFGVPVDVPTGYLREMVFEDFDLDGHVDIGGLGYVPADSSVLTIIRNQNPKGILSAGNFLEPYKKPLSYYLHTLGQDDLNNDGKVDLVAAGYHRTTILKNNSHPGVFEFDERVVPDSRHKMYAQYLGQDLNEDGWKELVSYSRYHEEEARVQENEGFSPEITMANPVVIFNGYRTVSLEPGDINGDGQVDLVFGTHRREFVFFENKTWPDESFTDSSFVEIGKYGLPLAETGTVETQVAINDLNGDGKPEVITANTYFFWPRDGYSMEIWQNSPTDCPDPSLVTVDASYAKATITLPENTTLDQFEIDYARSNAPDYWMQAWSTTLYLYDGISYVMRVRAKCHLGFTAYHYLEFTTDCVDVSTFSIGNVDVTTAALNANNLASIKVEYSPDGADQWVEVPQNANKISNLLAGTTYDVRYRGRCYEPGKYYYKEFTTLCPKLSSLGITDLFYNRALVTWSSDHNGNAVLEYSPDEATWTAIDQSRTMYPLVPGKTYYVRGRLECTDTISDFIHKSFLTPCPAVSLLSAEDLAPFSATLTWADESATGS